ncbi:MAG: RNA polymerase sigma factor [Candidatus Glassbacteria bacterium]
MELVTDDISNRQLVEECSHGNRRAIEIFYHRYKDLIFSAIHRWMDRYAPEMRGSEEVREVFQEAIVAVMENNFARVRKARDPEQISGLIFLIAFQRTGRYFERKWRDERRRTDRGDPVYNPEDDIIDGLTHDERMRLADKFVKTLRSIEREVIGLYFKDGCRYREIAEITGLTTTNVGVMISRIKDRFRSFIKEEYGSDL